MEKCPEKWDGSLFYGARQGNKPAPSGRGEKPRPMQSRSGFSRRHVNRNAAAAPPAGPGCRRRLRPSLLELVWQEILLCNLHTISIKLKTKYQISSEYCNLLSLSSKSLRFCESPNKSMKFWPKKPKIHSPKNICKCTMNFMERTVQKCWYVQLEKCWAFLSKLPFKKCWKIKLYLQRNSVHISVATTGPCSRRVCVFQILLSLFLFSTFFLFGMSSPKKEKKNVFRMAATLS